MGHCLQGEAFFSATMHNGTGLVSMTVKMNNNNDVPQAQLNPDKAPKRVFLFWFA